MAESTVTLTLPSGVYDQLEQRARRHHRRVEDEAALALSAAVSSNDTLPRDFAAALATLPLLDNEALQRISHSQPTVEDGVLLDALIDQRRRRGLTPDEERLLAELVDRHDRVMALRAEAVALLYARGVDVRERLANA